MKKKSLLISGLIVLGAAIGVTSFAVTSGNPGISLFAEGDAEEPVAPVEATVKYPGADSYSLPSFNINQVYLEFASPVTPNFSADASILIEVDKSTFTATNIAKLYEIATTDAENVSVEGNKLTVKLPEALPVGVYYVTVPEGVVKVDGVPNAAAKWSFTVKDAVKATGEYPAEGAKLGSGENITALWVNYETGDGMVDINRSLNASVVIKKDGEVYKEFPASDTAHLTDDLKFYGHFVIKLDEALQGGSYTVSVPEGLVIAKGPNAAFEWSFTVQQELVAECDLKSGGTYSLAKFATVTVTYPEGTTLTLNEGKAAALYNFKTGTAKVFTEYTASVSGNVMTLTAVDPNKIEVANKIQSNYLYISIPDGMVNVKNGEDVSYANSAMKFGNFLSEAFLAADFKFIPALETRNLSINDLKEITLVLPEGAEFCGKQLTTTNVLNLYPADNTSNYSWYYGYYFKSISEDGKQVVCELAPQSSPTALIGNVDYIQPGPASLKLNGSMVQVAGTTTQKNGAISFNGVYDLVGGMEEAGIYNSTPANLSGQTSISGLTLNFPRKVVVNNPDAEITLKRGNEVIKSVKASATTTKAAQEGGAGSSSVSFANLFKVKEDPTAEDSKEVAIETPGVYTYHVPAGAFKQVEGPDFLSQEKDIVVYIVGGVEYESISPKPATFAKDEDGNLVATPGEELTELYQFTLTYPANATITLIPTWKNNLSSSGIAQQGANNLVPTVKAPYSFADKIADATVDGNKITFTLAEVYKDGTKKNYGLALKIPKGLFTVSVPGEDGAVNEYANPEIVVGYQGIPMEQGPIGMIGKTQSGAASIQYLNEEEPYVLASNMADIVYKGAQTLYPKATTPKATLYDEEGKVVIAEYEGKAPAEALYLNSTYVEFTPTADYAEAVASLPTGSYQFIINEGTLQAGSSTVSSAIFNNKNFVYDVEVLNSTMAVEPASGSTVTSLSTITLTPSDVSLMTANEGVVPTVYYKKEQLDTYGDKEIVDVDITTEGYKVELNVVSPPDPDEEEVMTLDLDDEMGYAPNVKAEIVITPALTNAETYYVHVPAGMLNLMRYIKSDYLDLEYKVVPPVAFQGLLTPMMPASYDFSIEESIGAEDGEARGMSALMLTAPANVELAAAPESKIEMLYNGKVIAEIGVATEETEGVGVVDMGGFAFYDETETPAEPGETPAEPGDDTEDPGEPAQPTTKMLAFYFATEPTAEFMKAGAYTINIPEGFFVADGTPVAAGQLVYNMTLPSVPFEKNFALGTPSEQVFFLSESYGAEMGRPMGMGMLELKAADGILLNEASKAKVQIYFGDKLLAEVGVPGEDDAYGIYQMGGIAGAADEDEYGGFAGDDNFGVDADGQDGEYGGNASGDDDNFGQDAEGQDGEYGGNASGDDDDFGQGGEGGGEDYPVNYTNSFLIVFPDCDDNKYKALGEYKVVIPAGLFVNAQNAEVSGIDLVYTLAEEPVVEYTYTITPANGTEFEGVIGGEITLTVEGAKFIDYDAPTGFLYNPEGQKMVFQSNYPKIYNNGPSFVWSLEESPKKPQTWNDGTYTFKIDKNTIYINVYADEVSDFMDPTWPEEDIVVNYILKNGVTAVAIVGVEAADSYNVYTLDGKVVLLNGSADQMIDLTPGLYIINGKKAYIRK